VIFDVGRESLVRVPMMEPERGTKKHVGRASAHAKDSSRPSPAGPSIADLRVAGDKRLNVASGTPNCKIDAV
jgi:hypothetical protein